MTTHAPQPGHGAPPAGAAGPGGPAPLPRGLTLQGVRTVAQLEVRQRLRSTRWKVALAVWFVLVGLVTGGIVLVFQASTSSFSGGVEASVAAGRTIFGLVVLFVLFLGLLVAPTLSATTVNGDRNNGTLAVLQATTLSSWDIAVGKLLASWSAALAFLVVSLPFLVWGMAMGGTAVLGGIGSVVVVAFLLLVVCAVGLLMSSLVSRPAGSAVLTYVTVAALSVGTLIAFGLSSFFVTSRETVQVYGVDWRSDSMTCTWYEEERDVTHLERTAWMLGLNPFVVVADVVGASEAEYASDPISAISLGVRWAQQGPTFDECWGDEVTAPEPGVPVWPWSTAVYALGGIGSVVLAARRLRIPAGSLPRGTRVA